MNPDYKDEEEESHLDEELGLQVFWKPLDFWLEIPLQEISAFIPV